jgi:hypothetical protein
VSIEIIAKHTQNNRQMAYVGHAFRFHSSSSLLIVSSHNFRRAKKQGSAARLRQDVSIVILTAGNRAGSFLDRRAIIYPNHVLIALFFQFERVGGNAMQALPDDAKRLRMCKGPGRHA